MEVWRRLNVEQRVAGVGAVLLIVSTFGPFSFVEAAVVLTALGVLGLLRQRAERRRFHLPFGDGTVILAAALWCALLIVVRLFDRPLGQSVLALGCAAILGAAGLRERAKRPPDDLPPPPRSRPAPPLPPAGEEPTERLPGEGPAPDDPTERLPGDGPAPGEPTVRLPLQEPGEPPPNGS